MEIGHVVPANHLELSELGGFDFCLAHIALRDEAYKQFFIKRAREERSVYLDNGVWELGQPLDADTMIELAVEMQPEYVYAPDYMNDAARTVQAAQEFGELAYKHPDFRAHVVCVSQGRTQEEWYNCVRKLAGLPYRCCHTIAINTLFIDDMFEYEEREGARRTKTRLEFLMLLDRELHKFNVKRFYATGFGAPIDAKELARFHWLRGADTAIASVLALSEREIDAEMATHFKPKGTIDGDITFTDRQYVAAVKNMLTLNTWAAGREPHK